LTAPERLRTFPAMEVERGPATEYKSRLDARRSRERASSGRERLLSHARLVAFVLGAAAAWAILALDRVSDAWLLLAPVPFFAAVVAHDRARRETLRAARAARFYERGIERLEHRFAGTGRSREDYADPEHPYAAHLDLFGPGSLFELLSTAQTRAGEEVLARWLLEPAEPAEIGARNEAAAELRPALDLREDLATLGPDVREGLHPEALAAWGGAPALLHSPVRRAIAAGMAGLTVTTAALWFWAGVGALPFLFAVGVQSAFAWTVRRRVATVVEQVDAPARDLRLFSALLARLEREQFSSPQLRALRAALDVEGRAPSAQIASLLRRVELLESRRNQLFALLAPFLLWTTQCALAIEAWRVRYGPQLEAWIATVGELEALGDLAAYAYEHPGDPFPEVVEGGPLFDGEGLGHPLIPDDRCVRNDLSLDGDLRLLIVSGSNMSGKSTLLRTIGINVALAQAGAPVRARRLRLSPLQIGASIRIQDSLQEGTSRFYTEITTLRRIVQLTGEPQPVLFLLDEVLNGTNSHDRRIGAAGVLRGLVERGAMGLVTTHDLALVEIADGLGPRAANVHFEDELRDGQLVFDYKLRPGVVQRSNALELMRAVGLEV
jgi:hypothetical protein